MSNKVVTEAYLSKILDKLYKWMPLKRNNGGIIQNEGEENTLQTINNGEVALGKYNETDSNTLLTIGIGEEGDRKNAIKICKNGEIYIISNIQNRTTESLQSLLDKKGVTICDSYIDMMSYSTQDYLGKMLYLTSDSYYEDQKYDEGLYIVSLGNGGVKLIKIADALKKELSNYYTKAEVEKMINEITLGDFSGVYYTKTEVDNLINPLIDKVDQHQEFMHSPISVNDLEEITMTDINKNGIVGK